MVGELFLVLGQSLPLEASALPQTQAGHSLQACPPWNLRILLCSMDLCPALPCPPLGAAGVCSCALPPAVFILNCGLCGLGSPWGHMFLCLLSVSPFNQTHTGFEF